jgi:hypothetical protein
MNLRNLPPMIQERILSKAEDQRTPMPLTESSLRRICSRQSKIYTMRNYLAEDGTFLRGVDRAWQTAPFSRGS